MKNLFNESYFGIAGFIACVLVIAVTGYEHAMSHSTVKKEKTEYQRVLGKHLIKSVSGNTNKVSCILQENQFECHQLIGATFGTRKGVIMVTRAYGELSSYHGKTKILFQDYSRAMKYLPSDWFLHGSDRYFEAVNDFIKASAELSGCSFYEGNTLSWTKEDVLKEWKQATCQELTPTKTVTLNMTNVDEIKKQLESIVSSF